MAKSKKYNNIDTAVRLMEAMQIAIENMIQEIQKPVDKELSGSQRKAELQTSAPPKPRGHRWHWIMTAALHIANDKRVALQIALQTARLSAFGVQCPSISIACTRRATSGRSRAPRFGHGNFSCPRSLVDSSTIMLGNAFG